MAMSPIQISVLPFVFRHGLLRRFVHHFSSLLLTMKLLMRLLFLRRFLTPRTFSISLSLSPILDWAASEELEIPGT